MRQGKTGEDSGFVSFNPQDKALHLADLAGSGLFKPGVEVVSCPGAQHLRELLDQLIGLIHLGVQRPKHEQGFLLFSAQLFRLTKEEERGISCKNRRTRKQIGSLGILPS